jgi:hypothetical protein
MEGQVHLVKQSNLEEAAIIIFPVPQLASLPGVSLVALARHWQ